MASRIKLLMRLTFAHKAFVTALGLGCAGGCDRTQPVAPRPTTVVSPVVNGPPRPVLDGRQVFTLRGVVKKVDIAEGEVTIAHEAMPGFMGAMVMPFTLKDKSQLEDVEPGDVVHGPLVVEFAQGKVKDYELTDLIATGLTAPPEPGTTAGLVASFAKPKPLQVGDLVPDFTITTQTGATAKLSDFRGKVVALTFIYTRCPLPDFCPAVDAKFADLARRLALSHERLEQVQLLSISFDPAHDTPEVLAAYAKLRGAKPPWMFAVASVAELAKIAPLFGLDYYPERDQFAHNLTTAVIGPDGHLACLELGRNWTPNELFSAIVAAITPKHRP